MSIPLDRLYHYLDSLCNEDIIIYRWMPHGSKKLEDLAPYKNQATVSGNQLEDSIKNIITPPMICHDQEPLNYNFYSESDIFDYLTLQSFKGVSLPKQLARQMSTRHLTAAVSPHNIHDYTLLCHSEKNSRQLDLYEQNNFIGVYYWSHALIAKDWYRFAEYDSFLKFDVSKICYDFLIYNRAWTGTREYRLKFLELLIDMQLQNFCNVKFNPIDTDLHYTDHIFENKNFKLQNKNMELTIPLNTSQSDSSANYNNNDYNGCAVEVVLETLFDDTRNHLTEKILRPIACGKPFILASTPNSLSYLKDYGFKTFHEFINESYDQIIDPVERLQAIITEMHRISNLSRQEKIFLWEQLYNIAEYNKQHFFSEKFHNSIVEEFVTNFKTAYKKCQNQTSHKWYTLFKNCDSFQPIPEFRKTVDYVDLHINSLTSQSPQSTLRQALAL